MCMILYDQEPWLQFTSNIYIKKTHRLSCKSSLLMVSQQYNGCFLLQIPVNKRYLSITMSIGFEGFKQSTTLTYMQPHVHKKKICIFKFHTLNNKASWLTNCWTTHGGVRSLRPSLLKISAIWNVQYSVDNSVNTRHIHCTTS